MLTFSLKFNNHYQLVRPTNSNKPLSVTQLKGLSNQITQLHANITLTWLTKKKGLIKTPFFFLQLLGKSVVVVYKPDEQKTCLIVCCWKMIVIQVLLCIQRVFIYGVCFQEINKVWFQTKPIFVSSDSIHVTCSSWIKYFKWMHIQSNSHFSSLQAWKESQLLTISSQNFLLLFRKLIKRPSLFNCWYSFFHPATERSVKHCILPVIEPNHTGVAP